MAEANGGRGKSDAIDHPQSGTTPPRSSKDGRRASKDASEKSQPKLPEAELASEDGGDSNPRQTTKSTPSGSKQAKSSAKKPKPALTEDEKRKLDKMASKMELCLTLGALKFQAVYRGTPRHSPEPFDLFAEFGDAVNTSNIADDEWQDVPLTQPGWWFVLHPRPSTLAVDPLSPDATPINSFSVDDIANFMHVRYIKEKPGQAHRRRAPRSAPLTGDIHCHLIYRPTSLPVHQRITAPKPLQDFFEARTRSMRKSSEGGLASPTSSLPTSPTATPSKAKSSLDNSMSYPEVEPTAEDEELAQRYLAMAAIYESDSEMEVTDVDVLPIKKKYWSPNSKIVLSRPRKAASHVSYIETLKRDASAPPITIYELPQSEYKMRVNAPLPSARKKMTTKDGARLAGVSVRTVFHADRSLFEEQTDHLLVILKGGMIEGIVLHVPFESLPDPFQKVGQRVAEEWAEYHRHKQRMFRPDTQVFLINRFAPPDQRLTEGQEDPYDDELVYPEQMDRKDLRLALLQLGFSATQGIPTVELRKKLRQMRGMDANDPLDEANIPARFKQYRDYELPELPDLPKVEIDVDISDESDQGAEEDLTDTDNLLEEEDEFDSDSDSDDSEEAEEAPERKNIPLPLSPTKAKRLKSRTSQMEDVDEETKRVLSVPDILPPAPVRAKRGRSRKNSESEEIGIEAAVEHDDEDSRPAKKPLLSDVITAESLVPDSAASFSMSSDSVVKPISSGADIDLEISDSLLSLAEAFRSKSPVPSSLSSSNSTQLLSMMVPDPFSQNLKSWMKEDDSKQDPSDSELELTDEQIKNHPRASDPAWLQTIKRRKVHDLAHLDLSNCNPTEGRKPRSSSVAARSNLTRYTRPTTSSSTFGEMPSSDFEPKVRSATLHTSYNGSAHSHHSHHAHHSTHGSHKPKSRRQLTEEARDLAARQRSIAPLVQSVSVPLDASAEEYANAMRQQQAAIQAALLGKAVHQSSAPMEMQPSRALFGHSVERTHPGLIMSAPAPDANLAMAGMPFPMMPHGLIPGMPGLDPRLATLRGAFPTNPLELAQLSMIFGNSPLTMGGLNFAPGLNPFGMPGAGFGFLPFPQATSPFLHTPMFSTTINSQMTDAADNHIQSPADITKSL